MVVRGISGSIKIEKTCSVRYKIRKIYKIFYIMQLRSYEKNWIFLFLV